MIELHKAADRGVTHTSWLESRHSFSFAGWHDPSRIGFHSLRVLNEDHVAPGAGFGTHSHRDMEILTVVLAGALEHRDSAGSRSILRAGDVQCMSAGSGVSHSEWNASKHEPLHFLQIWLRPDRTGTRPAHRESRRVFPVAGETPAGLRAIAANAAGGGVLEIQQDAQIFGGHADASTPLSHPLPSGRGVWVQVVRGALSVNGTKASEGDGVAIERETSVSLVGDPEADFLLFDLSTLKGAS